MNEKKIQVKLEYIKNCVWWLNNPSKVNPKLNRLSTIETLEKHLEELKKILNE